jgi:LmbE family N-acetylglucosaminyl deacetylase
LIDEPDPYSDSMPDESVDLVVAIGCIEHLEWDRWALEQAHRQLRNGGILLLVVPNRLAIASARDLIDVSSRVVAWTRRKSTGGSRRPHDKTRTTHRYALAPLKNMLSKLGYEVHATHPCASPWVAPIMRSCDSRAARFASGFVVVCERRARLFGRDPRRPYPDPELHKQRFEQQHASDFDTLHRWSSANLCMDRTAAQPFDPTQYRAKDVMVLAPHPDDELIGCGGTLSRLIAEQARVKVVHVTDGGAAAALRGLPTERIENIRLEEARAVAVSMGFDSLVFLREPDGALEERASLVDRLTTLIRETRPALIFAPFITDGHRDHRALSKILARAIRARPDLVSETRVLAYEVWNVVPRNRYCDITDVAPILERQLLHYATALKAEDYLTRCQDRNFYNSYALTGRCGFVEAFFDVEAEEFSNLVLQ